VIICLEGPSAAGKTTLARALGAVHGAAVVPELDATGAPPPERAEPWFAERHAGRWMHALKLASTAPLVVMDCDPLKGLWYNWMHAADGWPGVDVVEPLYRARIERGELGFPARYVYLDASEAQLRRRRADDPTRQRRGFEKNVRTLVAQRRYFAALDSADPGRVAFMDTADRETLADRVARSIARARTSGRDDVGLLGEIARWVRGHA
jgi:hypothetical protein